MTSPKADAVKSLVEEVTASLGEVDILVNNAALFGQLPRARFTDISSEDWDRVMSVNVRGTFKCCKAVLPAMKKKQYGKIVNITSSTVFMGQPMLLHYVTSKGAIIAMIRAMAREVGDFNICVNSLAPGLTMSEAVQQKFENDRARLQSLVEKRSLKREQLPNDLVGAVLFLSSTDSDFMTGQTMVVDGGAELH